MREATKGICKGRLKITHKSELEFYITIHINKAPTFYHFTFV